MNKFCSHKSEGLNLIILLSYDPIDIQEGGADFIGYKIVILNNPTVRRGLANIRQPHTKQIL